MTEYLDQPFDLEDPAVAAVLDEVSFWSSHFGALLADEIELRPGLAVLDLGCGNGFPLFELAGMHGPSCRFVGLDVWSAALRRAATKRAQHRLLRVDLVRGDGAALPFQRGSFDLVVSNVGVNNFADPAAVLGECARVLTAGGRLALTTNLEGHMAELYEVMRDLLREQGDAAALARLEANEKHRGSEGSLRAQVAAAGLRVARVVRRDLVLRYLDGGALLRHPLIRFGFSAGWREAVGREAERARFAELERRLDALAKRRGELRMSVPMLYLEALAE